jgi:hypothetical protein
MIMNYDIMSKSTIRFLLQVTLTDAYTISLIPMYYTYGYGTWTFSQ